MTEGKKVLEFSSDERISQRFHDIIDSINGVRNRINKTDDYGNPLADPSDLLDRIFDLYKEICVELTPSEDEIYEDKIKPLQNKMRSNPPNIKIEGQAYWKKTLSDLDDLDINLRKMAKAHGFYAKNIRTKEGMLK